MIMLGLGVVYMDNGDKYSFSMTPTNIKPTKKFSRSKFGVLYSIFEYVLAFYYEM